ncbi:MAG: hypothetical protein DWQ34_04590 [Planctomycetota bacterium]|nr:MAG: hypothetical protein DWQ34_04590 [Planctomycetota bacterium]REK21087.1 MAG: hypothetical protein DWQ41_22735 [Planctomycetota bacterium]
MVRQSRQRLPLTPSPPVLLLNPGEAVFVILPFERPPGVQPFVPQVFRHQMAGHGDCLEATVPVARLVETLRALDKKRRQVFRRRHRVQIPAVLKVLLGPHLGPLDVVGIGIERDPLSGTLDVEAVGRNPEPHVWAVPVDRRAVRVVPAEQQMTARFDQVDRQSESPSDRHVDDRH